MKNILVIIAFLILSNNAFSQTPISQGSFLFSGGFSLSSNSGSYEKTNSNGSKESTLDINFKPVVSYFVMDGLAVGIKGYLMYLNYGVGAQTAYFINLKNNDEKIKGNLYPYFGVSFVKNLIFDKKATSLDNGLQWSIAVGPGLMIMISKSIALNVELGYQYDKFKYEGYDTKEVWVDNGFGRFLTRVIIKKDFDISGSRLNFVIGMSVSL